MEQDVYIDEHGHVSVGDAGRTAHWDAHSTQPPACSGRIVEVEDPTKVNSTVQIVPEGKQPDGRPRDKIGIDNRFFTVYIFGICKKFICYTSFSHDIITITITDNLNFSR